MKYPSITLQLPRAHLTLDKTLSLKIFICLLVIAIHQMRSISPQILKKGTDFGQLTHFLQHLRIPLFAQPGSVPAFLLSSDVQPLTKHSYISTMLDKQ